MSRRPWRRSVEPVDLDDVQRRYEQWPEKGPVGPGGARLTLLADRTSLVAGEAVRVFHVLERTEPGQELSVMGPKVVYGELVDGEPAGPPLPAGEDALDPNDYDGLVVPSPDLDANFQASVYRFEEPGRHELRWEAEGLRSNTLTIEVARAAGLRARLRR